MILAATFAQDCNNIMITRFVAFARNAVNITERWQVKLAVATRKTNHAQHLCRTPIIAIKTLIGHWHNSNLMMTTTANYSANVAISTSNQ